MIRLCGLLTASAATGVALAALSVWVVLGYGPESLLDFGEAVYDDTGHYLGVR